MRGRPARHGGINTDKAPPPPEAARGELLVRDPVVERRAEGMFVGFHDVNLWTANAANAHGIAVVVLAIRLLFHICH